MISLLSGDSRLTLGQRRCLPSCSNNGFHTSANFESNLSDIWYGGRSRDSRVVVNLHVTSAPGYIGSNAKTLGLQYLQFLDTVASGARWNGAGIDHHGTDELFIQLNIIPYGETASSVQERSRGSQSPKRRPLYLKPQSVPRCKHFSSGL